MNSLYEWSPAQYEPVVAVMLTAAGFSLYWFIAMSQVIKSRFFAKAPVEKAWMNYVVFQKLTGVLFLGVIPAIVIFTTTGYSASDLGLNLDGLEQSLWYGGIMSALILILNYFATNNPDRLKDFPQMRIVNWTYQRIVINALSWTAYLIAYEFLFRGILLFLCYSAFGFWPSVAINLALYATTHIPKGAGETFGTFPYGLLLCYVSISTGSILVAIATHLVMAISNDLFSIYHNAEMKFSR